MPIFVCYAASGRGVARQLVAALKRVGVDVFHEEASLRPGDKWDVAIPRALAQAEAALLILTATPGDSESAEDWYFADLVIRAVDRAARLGIPIIPVALEGVPLGQYPLGLARLVPLVVRHGRWDEAVETIQKTLGIRGTSGNPPPLPQRIWSPAASSLNWELSSLADARTSLHRHESVIEMHLRDSLPSILEAAGLERDGAEIRLGAKRVQITGGLVPGSRIFHLQILPRGGGVPKVTQVSEHVSGCGKVGQVSVLGPSSLRSSLRYVAHSISSHLSFQYGLVKRQFLAQYEAASSQFIGRIDRYLAQCLEAWGLLSLQHRLVPTVTRLSSLRLRYILDHRMVAKTLSEFEAAGDAVFGPLELLMALIFGEAPHTINKKFRDFQPGRTLYLPTSEFVSLGEDLPFYIGEAALFMNEELAEFNVGVVDGYILQIGVPRALESTLVPRLVEVKDVLMREFAAGLSDFLLFAESFQPQPPGRMGWMRRLSQFWRRRPQDCST